MALTLFVDHQFTSPFGMSAYVSLLEKGIPFVTERLDLGAQQHQQATSRSVFTHTVMVADSGL